MVTTTRRQFLAGLVAAAAGGGLAACAGRRPDVIIRGGPIITVAPGMAEAEALAITGGRITKVGTLDAFRGNDFRGVRVIDLKGRALLPAFIEPHSHPFEIGTTLAPPAVDARPFTVPTAAGVNDKIAEAIRATPVGKPILFNGIDSGTITRHR